MSVEIARLYLLPALLARYRVSHPTFDLEFQIGAVDEIAERVIRNDLDIAVIAGRPPTDELRVQTLIDGELVAIGAPAKNRPARERQPALGAQCWIMREEKSTTRREVEAWLNRQKIVPARTMTFDGPEAVKRAVTAGLGIAAVSKLTVDEDLKARRVIRLDLGRPLPTRTVYLIDHPHKHHGAACSAMLKLFSATFPRMA